jgi:hypothetical protein
MHNDRELKPTIEQITDEEITEIIRYLDPAPPRYKTGESDDTVIMVVVSVVMFLLAALPFISLYLRTS